MKKIIQLAILLLMFPLQMLAQYGGGNGRGERLKSVNITQLNGRLLSLYSGGNGRGEMLTAVNTNQLNGKAVLIYSGGNGRGEIFKTSNANGLDGGVVSLYNGGNGRGEILTALKVNELDGKTVNLYNGGNGRGEILYSINTVQLNGKVTLLYRGGNGRGEILSTVKAVQLDGVTANLYMGGNGRGETMVQLNTQSLPVQLICFGAMQDDNRIKVYWQTASEINSDNFVVEKLVDNKNWKPIDTIKAAYNSDITLSYQLFDANPTEGSNLYRLQSSNTKGLSVYSNVSTVYYHTSPSYSLAVFPNPAKYQFTISISNSKVVTKVLGHYNITMVDATGRTVLQKQGLSGNTQTIDVANLIPGAYFVVVNINGVASTVKVIKE